MCDEQINQSLLVRLDGVQTEQAKQAWEIKNLICLTTKPTKWHVHPAKTDQPGHLPCLIRVLAVHLKKAWVLSYPLSVQWRLWSDWADAQADAQADLKLHWVHMPFCWFVKWLQFVNMSSNCSQNTEILRRCSTRKGNRHYKWDQKSFKCSFPHIRRGQIPCSLSKASSSFLYLGIYMYIKGLAETAQLCMHLNIFWFSFVVSLLYVHFFKDHFPYNKIYTSQASKQIDKLFFAKPIPDLPYYFKISNHNEHFFFFRN